uniref:Cul-5 n=1 Tax=Pristionchus pacificus TaxID=54126 RepID=A0A2A6C9V1_PRIPA|eukprot:PDM74907.1 cul-5 [Pristionchus pacificus]
MTSWMDRRQAASSAYDLLLISSVLPGDLPLLQVSLPHELEELVSPVEGYYGKIYNGRKLHWLHHWSTAAMMFKTREGASFELEVTTFQLAVLFCWNDRPDASLSLESLRVATELPDTELVKTLFSLCSMPKLKYQVLLVDERPPINPKKFTDSTEFRLNHGFKLNGREQERGKLSLVGRLQLSLESTAKAEHEEIIALRQIRVQEAVVKVMKTRKELSLASLEHELINVLKPMFVPSKVMMKEQLEWLLENNFITRKESKMDIFQYVS